MRVLAIICLLAMLAVAHRRIAVLECQLGMNPYGNNVWNAEARTCVSGKAPI